MAQKIATIREHALAVELYFIHKRRRAWDRLMDRGYNELELNPPLYVYANDYLAADSGLRMIRRILDMLELPAYATRGATNCEICGVGIAPPRCRYCRECFAQLRQRTWAERQEWKARKQAEKKESA